MSSDEAFGWRITDEEWREFQEIPEQGFSHRAWVDCRLQQRIEWQANRDAVRIAEMESEIEGIKCRDAEVSDDEGWWVGGAWGDYGEAVVPLRILSYVIDGNLDEKVTSIDPGFALTYAEQTARAEDAEAKINEVRELHQPARLVRGEAEFCHECTDPWPCRTARALEERTDT